MTAFVTNSGSGGATFEADTEGAANWPLTKLGWGAQGSGQRATLLQPIPFQPAATNFFFSASGQNTSTTQLAAAATFTGTIENTSSQQCISILLTVDQPGTLTINQFIDSGGTFKTNSYVYNILAGVSFSENFTANGNYAQVVFKNTGVSTTTTLNLNTAYGTLPAVDNFGNSPVSLPMIFSTYNVAGVITINTILLTIDCINSAGISIQCTAMGTTGVVTPQWSNDGVTYLAEPILTPAAVSATTITAAGLWTSPVYGRFLQLKLTTATTAGTTTFAVQSMPVYSAGLQANTIVQPTTSLLQTSATQVVGTAATRWFTQLSDGTTSPAIKAASTAAAFTDPALTVDPRPGGALVTASATLADALVNPTLGRVASLSALYNGTTWDLQRGMSTNNTTGDTGAKVATGNGATITNVGNNGVSVVLNMGAVTGTTPTCVLKLQGSADGGTTWYDISGATTASLVATGVWGITVYPGTPTVAGTTTSISGTASCGQPLPRTWRTVWTIGGTSPSFTITNIQYNYIPN